MSALLASTAFFTQSSHGIWHSKDTLNGWKNNERIFIFLVLIVFKMQLKGFCVQTWKDASGLLWVSLQCWLWWEFMQRWLEGGVKGASRGRCGTRDGNSTESLPFQGLKLENVLVSYVQKVKELCAKGYATGTVAQRAQESRRMGHWIQRQVTHCPDTSYHAWASHRPQPK